MEHINLHYIGEDYQGRPAYKSDTGKIYVDVNIARRKGEKRRICDVYYKSGEPDCPFIGTYTIYGQPEYDAPINGRQDWEYINNN